MTLIRLVFAIFLVHALMASREASAQVLDKQQQLGVPILAGAMNKELSE